MSFTPKKKDKQKSEQNDSAILKEKQERMRKFVTQKMSENNIALKEASNRNVIFVGKTRSGKSTALSVLKNPFHFVHLSSIFSETIDANINHFTVEVEGDGSEKHNFNVSIIDTPGLFEVVDRGTARDQQALENLILRCMKSEITKINMIFFVVSYAGAVNVQDIEALESFIKLFKGAQGFVHVLVTKCENFTEEEKKKIEEEFRKYPQLANLLSNVGEKVFFMGAVEQRTFDQGYEDQFRDSLERVMEMREELFYAMFQQEKSFELKTLEMVDKVRIRAEEYFKEISKRYEERESKPDPQALKAKCKELGNWLPLLDANAYEQANSLLIKCDDYIRSKEKELEANPPKYST